MERFNWLNCNYYKDRKKKWKMWYSLLLNIYIIITNIRSMSINCKSREFIPENGSDSAQRAPLVMHERLNYMHQTFTSSNSCSQEFHGTWLWYINNIYTKFKIGEWDNITLLDTLYSSVYITIFDEADFIIFPTWERLDRSIWFDSKNRENAKLFSVY